MPSLSTFPMRNYVISRKAGADAEDPTSLDFWPAKGSDELYDALREAFPAYKTHKDRMREAVMEFYMQERDEEAALGRSMSSTSAATAFTTMPEAAMPSPAYFLHHQHSQRSLQTTPDYLPSPESQFTNTFPSTPAVESGNEQVSAIPNSISVPGLREMTNVWSVSSNSQPKLRTRRAMTESEKKEYRRRRIDGACSECRRRRRKCDHASSESESPSRRVKKVCRTTRTSANARQEAPAAKPYFLEQSSTGTSPSLAHTSPNQQTQMDLPSSMLWPELQGLEFPDMQLDSDLSNGYATYDPIFDCVDFGEAGTNEAGLVSQGSLNYIWPSSAFSQPQQGTASSGIIMPLPSYYARTEVSQDHLSSGGTVSSPASPANMLLTQQKQTDGVGIQHTTGTDLEEARPEPERVWIRGMEMQPPSRTLQLETFMAGNANAGTPPNVVDVDDGERHNMLARYPCDSPGIAEPATQRADSAYGDSWHKQRKPAQKSPNVPKVGARSLELCAALPHQSASTLRLEAAVVVASAALVAVVASCYGPVNFNSVTAISLIITAVRSVSFTPLAVTDKAGQSRWHRGLGWWSHAKPMIFG